MDQYHLSISQLQKSDYHNGYLQLLEQLTTVGAPTITYDNFCKQFDRIKSNVFVVKYHDQVIGTASALIECKFTHQLSNVCHIEDVVVDLNYRKKGIGKTLVTHCIDFAKKNDCYKIILNCDQKNIGFYEKIGFTQRNVEMSIYVN
jgi:glucosamine-phosphate N-acetyltransferase